MKNRQISGGGNDITRAADLADNQQRVAALKLRVQRCAQGTCRKYPAVADAAAAVDHGKREILGKRSVLQAVVHDDNTAARGHCCLRSGDAVARDNRRRAHAPAAVLRRRLRAHDRVGVDRFGAGEAAAIAAAETAGPLAGVLQHFRQGHDGRRLAGAAEREISHAQHRQPGARARSPPSAARRWRHRPRQWAPAGSLRARLGATRMPGHAWPARRRS